MERGFFMGEREEMAGLITIEQYLLLTPYFVLF